MSPGSCVSAVGAAGYLRNTAALSRDSYLYAGSLVVLLYSSGDSTKGFIPEALVKGRVAQFYNLLQAFGIFLFLHGPSLVVPLRTQVTFSGTCTGLSAFSPGCSPGDSAAIP